MKQPRKPLDLAIALRYDGNSAPRVTAKGKGAIADRIIEKAKEHQIPLRSDPALAGMLAAVPLGDEIPRELYLAVAEVLAFAYWLSEQQKANGGGGRARP